MMQRSSVPALFLLIACGLSSSAQAIQFHFDLERDEALVECDIQHYAGQNEAATKCFQALINDQDALVRAEAASALGDVRLANRLFREASENDDNPAIKTGWGNVFLSTHQVSDAIALYREALLFDPDYHSARLGLARALTNTFEGEARRELQQILQDEPNHPGALTQMARLELEQRDTASARKRLELVVPELEQYQVPPLEVYALYAAANLLEGKSINAWTKKALALNANYGEVFSIPAHFYIITYRYREAVALYQAAVDVNPDISMAQRDLGVNLLRVNDIFGARFHLNKAFELDPYDAQTVNGLRLLDGLDDMQVTIADVDDESGNPLGRILLRLDREDADALEPYVLELAERAMRTFSERYDFRLKKPMVVELYHDHDDFGVRTVSTPGIGLLGVTFGYLTAMDSPKARPPGDFHWGSTLWHEIAHVYTLEATNHLLPRWMSEGLSVYEEWNTGPLQERRLSFDVLSAIRDETLLPIKNLDLGFVRPQYEGQVQVSYAQAGLLCDFIASRFGHNALKSMVQSFAKNEPLESALQNAVGLDSLGLDAAFLEFLDTRYGNLATSLDDFVLVTREAQGAIENEDWTTAAVLGEDLIQRYPENTGVGSGYDVLDAAYIALVDTDAMIDNRWQWFKQGGHDPEILGKLIRDLRSIGRTDDSVAVMIALNWVTPYSAEEHAWLGEHYLKQDDADGAFREFNALLAVSDNNPAEAYLGRAKAAMITQDTKSAREEVLFALEASPFYRPAQHLLLDLTSGNTK